VKAVVAAIENAPVTEEIWVIGNNHPIVSALEPTPADKLYRRLPASSWIPTPGGHQSLASASYRLGGDTSVGMSSLLAIWLPGPQRGSVEITLDIALSLRGGVAVTDGIRLWQSALMLLTGPIADALSGILPREADVTHVDIHAAAPDNSGQGHTRTEGLFEQLGLRIFGEPTDSVPRSIGQAMGVQGALDEHDAGEIVLDAVERIATQLRIPRSAARNEHLARGGPPARSEVGEPRSPSARRRR
jgi:hypothetical protein